MPLLRDPHDLEPNLGGPDPRLVAALRPLLDALMRYHDYRVEGLEHVPRSGPALVAVNHSLATYDGFLFGVALGDATGRYPASLGDDLIFRVPGLRRLGRAMGIAPGRHRNGEALLARGHLVALAPGGMREGLRPSAERYRVRWARRKGFARLAIRAGCPLLIAGCRGADDLYTVYETPLTKLAYRYFKLPIPLIRGLGPTLLPRPVPLVHRIAPPLIPPPLDPARFEEQVGELHARAVTVMAGLLAEAG